MKKIIWRSIQCIKVNLMKKMVKVAEFPHQAKKLKRILF